jgi:hypothetical protein
MRGSKRGASENVRAAALTHGGGYSITTPVIANLSSAASTHSWIFLAVSGSRSRPVRFGNGWTRGAGAAVVVLPRSHLHSPTSLARGSYG